MNDLDLRLHGFASVGTFAAIFAFFVIALRVLKDTVYLPVVVNHVGTFVCLEGSAHLMELLMNIFEL